MEQEKNKGLKIILPAEAPAKLASDVKKSRAYITQKLSGESSTGKSASSIREAAILNYGGMYQKLIKPIMI